jgi:hypothetical protein
MRSVLGHSDVPSAQSVNGSLPLADGGVSVTVAGAPLCDPAKGHPPRRKELPSLPAISRSCGKLGADIRPDLQWDKPGLLTRGF